MERFYLPTASVYRSCALSNNVKLVYASGGFIYNDDVNQAPRLYQNTPTIKVLLHQRSGVILVLCCHVDEQDTR